MLQRQQLFASVLPVQFYSV